MAAPKSDDHGVMWLGAVGLAAWLVPGAGYLLLGQRSRAVLVGVTIILTFLVGLYIGSIGVIDPVGAKPWFVAQVMNSPIVWFVGRYVANRGVYRVFGRPGEIGQIYTSIAGLLNLLCIVNAVYLAHLRSMGRNMDAEWESS